MNKVLSKLSILLASIVIVGMGLSGSAAANVNAFSIQNFQIDFYLDRDTEGRSTLRTEESITAIFPDYDQNHGIERAIPKSYDGRSIALDIRSVTDETGRALPYETRDEASNLVLRIGDASKFVRGSRTYNIVYDQRDVTKYFQDTNADEFYWDTNGTEWAVPINALSVRYHIPEDFRGSFKGEPRCYEGSAGTSNTCTIVPTENGYAVNATDLAAGENVTIAIGFEPETFAAYQPTLWERLTTFWLVSLVATLLPAVFVSLWFLFRYHNKSNRTKEVDTIIPEYLPPKDVSVSTSASIYRNTSRVFSAQLMDLAVRQYLKIYQTREKKILRPARYELEIVRDISPLKAEEKEILHDIFDDQKVGARLKLETLKNNSRVHAALSDNQRKNNEHIAGHYKLRARDENQSAWFKKFALYVLAIGVLTLSPWLLIAAVIGFVCASVLKPLTDNGLQLYRYLQGVKMYIKTAETDRLRMLQSPDGALKSGTDAADTRQLIKLYERLLPYAILFNEEKEWNKRIGAYYESVNESPSWFAGNNAVFNAVVISSALNGFMSAATYSAPSSSSSGGSGGGGFSGGGGGGGGGGGW